MTYATEETPLGTAGSVRNAMDQLDDTFLVISGDVLTDIDISEQSSKPIVRLRRSPPSVWSGWTTLSSTGS